MQAGIGQTAENVQSMTMPDIDWKLFRAKTDAEEAVIRQKKNLDELFKRRDQDRMDLEKYREKNERIRTRLSQTVGPSAHGVGSSQDHASVQGEEPPAPAHEARSSSVTFNHKAYMDISRRPRSLGRTLTRPEKEMIVHSHEHGQQAFIDQVHRLTPVKQGRRRSHHGNYAQVIMQTDIHGSRPGSDFEIDQIMVEYKWDIMKTTSLNYVEES